MAYYAGDYKEALTEFRKDQRDDPFIECMIGLCEEKLGDRDEAIAAFAQAAKASAHNPPTAFARAFARKQLAAGGMP